MNDTAVFIPARLESVRFPDKMLADTRGKPLIRYMFDKIRDETDYDVYVLTDSEEIADVIPYNVIKTSNSCLNGTERCAEACLKFSYENIVNVQGDFVGVTGDIIREVAGWIGWDEEIVTAHGFVGPDGIEDEDIVKVLLDGGDGRLMDGTYIHSGKWFTRLPHYDGFKHYGIYGYTKESLKEYRKYPQTKSELIESLEQLRWLGNNNPIGSVDISFMIGDEITAIDTIEQLKEFNNG